MFVTYSDVDKLSMFTFSAEASELGIRPGQFPDVIETNIGNKLPFYSPVAENEGRSVVYTQVAGCAKLKIYNT
jgi:hypothetical protein